MRIMATKNDVRIMRWASSSKIFAAGRARMQAHELQQVANRKRSLRLDAKWLLTCILYSLACARSWRPEAVMALSLKYAPATMPGRLI